MSTNFYNRQRELDFLEQALLSSKAELILLYGRRGVGKSALLEHALTPERGPVLYYRATRRTLTLQLESLAEALREAFSDAFLDHTLSSTDAFLTFLAHQAGKSPKPVIVVIDELSYLAEVDPGFLTAFQHWWDRNKQRTNLKVVLAGSYLSFMERQVLDVQAPLYHRRSGALLLRPLDYFDAALFFPGYSWPEKMRVYAILGGMPVYLEQFDPALGLEQNVCRNILRPHTFLSEEPEWLLLEDLRRDIIYGSILRALATGYRKPSDIARAIGKASAQDIFPRLATLVDMGLAVREVPVTDRLTPRRRNSLYWIADPYLEFWYHFVDPARTLVDRGLGASLWQRRIGPTLNEFVSRPTFERACRQFLWRALAAGRTPPGLHFVEVGNWWSGESELDVVAVNDFNRATLVGSCKWSQQPVDVKHLADLQKVAATAGLDAEEPYLALFSLSGFTRRLRELASRSERVWLVGLDELYAARL